MTLLTKLWWWLFAARKRWVCIASTGVGARFTLAGFDLTAADVREYHSKVTGIALGMGWRIVRCPPEIDTDSLTP